MDPLIKSHQITLIYQGHFDISSVRSGIEPESKLENVETTNAGLACFCELNRDELPTKTLNISLDRSRVMHR